MPASERATAQLLVLLLGIQLAISIPCAAFTAILRGLQRFGVLNALSVLGQLVSAFATVLIVVRGGGLIQIAVASIVVSLGLHGLTAWCVIYLAPELRFRLREPRRGAVGKILRFSSSTFAMYAASHLQMKTADLIIGGFLSTSVVAPYAMARRLSLLPQVFSDQFLKIFVPLSSQLHAQEDLHRLRSLYLAGSRLTLAVLVLIAAPLIALAGPILALWMGPDYAIYAPIVVILTLAVVVDTSQWPGMLILRGMARHHQAAIATVAAAVANLVLSLALVRPYGAMGVAFSALAPTLAMCFGFVWPYANRTLGVGAREAAKQVLLPALLPVLPMAAVFYVSRWMVETHSIISLLATAAAAAAVYMAGYLVTAGDLERQLIRDTLRKVLAILPMGAKQS